MESRSDQPPLIAIVGETASGKSALALELARLFWGEIIAADSRTIYKDMDIGTAKPTAEDQKLVPHHLLDVVEPSQTFSAANFKHLTEDAIQTISAKGKIPFLVGGTGLYVDAVLYDFTFREEPDLAMRARLQNLSVAELQARLREKHIPLPHNFQNPRHLIRALETEGAVGERKKLRPRTLVLGLSIDRDVLRSHIEARVDAMIAQGFVREVQSIVAQYGWEAPALAAPGYKSFRLYLQERISLDEAKALFVRSHLQLAKRQRTWFKRNKDIIWISKKEEAVDLITSFLNK